MSGSRNVVVSMALLAIGIALMNLAQCSHPLRFTPECIDPPRGVQCK